MKKILLIISVWTFIGCAQTTYSSEFNRQQTGFIQFMQSLSQEYRTNPNDLNAEKVNNKMEDYLHSLQPLVGWRGTISGIAVDTIGKNEEYVFSFDINFEYREFNCSLSSSYHYDTEEELQSSHFYKKLINLPNNSTVYFDGFIERAIDGKLTNFNENDMLKYIDPIFLFNTFEIYITQPKQLSPQLLKQLSLIYQRYCLYCKKDYKQITEREYRVAMSEMPKVDTKSLTGEENEYLNRCINELTASIFEDILFNP